MNPSKPEAPAATAVPHPGAAPSRRTLLAAAPALALAPTVAALAPAAAALGTLLPGPAQAGTPGVDEPPAPQPARAPVLPERHERRLPNGLTLLVLPQPGLPLVHAALLLRAGPELDPPDQPGLAQMTATLLAKGAQRGGRAVGAQALAQQAEALGGALDSSCSWAHSRLALTVGTAQLPAALALLADAWCRPLLAADELERARALALDGWRLNLGDPAELGRLVLRRSWWGDSPYGAVAPDAALRRLRLDAVRRFHAAWYRPERSALVLSGDIGPDEAQALAARLLGDWQPALPAGLSAAQAQRLRAPFAQPPAQARPRSPALVLVDLPGSGQSHVQLAAPFVALDAPDRVAGLVAQAVLGGDYSARLNQEVRIRRGLSYGAFSQAESLPGGGLWHGGAQTAHATAAEVLQVLRQQLQGLATQPPTPAELAARQATLAGQFARQLQTLATRAQLVGRSWLDGQAWDERVREQAALQTVSADAVAGFAQRHWPAEATRAVVVGDLAAAGAPLAALAREALRLSARQLALESPTLRRP